MFLSGYSSGDMNVVDKLKETSWFFLALVITLGLVGTMSLYSAAGGNMEPWAGKHLLRLIFGTGVMMCVAMVDIRMWAKLAYPFYLLCAVLLVIVDITGHIGMGAQRWINLGFIQLQPSEMMKIAMVLALARYFSMSTDEDVRSFTYLIKPLIGFVVVPVLLVLAQPDLGTATKLTLVSIAMFFLAGVPLWVFLMGGGAAVTALPILWHFMHDYQRKRVEVFLNPEMDPLGSGYHITQSMIALGSGGFGGKGFLEGTQAKLNFLPEKQTDFIFTLFAEEWGFVGSMGLFALLLLIIAYGIMIALRCQNQFGRMLGMGIIMNFSLYIFINIGMVMGLMPVVGIPLPMISNGGTALLSAMIGFGLVMSVWIHRDVKFNRRL